MARLIGWREWAALPDLGINRIKLKADSGARTSALHAVAIRALQIDGEEWVEFELDEDLEAEDAENADGGSGATRAPQRARVADCRTIRDSGGHEETRVVIETTICMGDESWPIELNLTDRNTMGFRMLLGRTAMEGRFYIDPGESFLLNARESDRAADQQEE